MSLVECGDNIELLKLLPDNSVDSIVTDPPYGIKFMGKRWDYEVPTVEQWQQCLRVLKPGGYLLSFASTRTQHKIATGIENAGFEIRDMIAFLYDADELIKEFIDSLDDHQLQLFLKLVNGEAMIAWVYGTGFPKSVNMGDGLGTALKPALEPITVARKPLEGTIKATHEKYGTGVLNIDACRVATDEQLRGGAGGLLSHQRDNKPYPNSREGEPSAEKRYDGVGFRMKPGERGGSSIGRFPANLIHDGTVPFPDAKGQQGKAKNDGTPNNNKVYGALRNITSQVEPRLDIDKTAARFFYCAKSTRKDRDYGCGSLPETTATDMVNRAEDSAGINNPRAGAGRTSGARNNHPTVKPIALCRYLTRLVTPPGGITLDPWEGSGSMGIGAVLEGFNHIGMEKEADHCHIANTRVKHALTESEVLMTLSITEYNADNKPTGRYCLVPGVKRDDLTDMLQLYGISVKIQNGQIRMSDRDTWYFVYQAPLKQTTEVSIEDIFRG